MNSEQRTVNSVSTQDKPSLIAELYDKLPAPLPETSDKNPALAVTDIDASRTSPPTSAPCRPVPHALGIPDFCRVIQRDRLLFRERGGGIGSGNSAPGPLARRGDQHNRRVGHGGPRLEAGYRRIAERRGNKKARTAVARRLLTLVFYGLRDGTIRSLQSPEEAA